jgi:hybrid polyketide synthase/nonribosomal peptide synthetase ACE1
MMMKGDPLEAEAVSSAFFPSGHSFESSKLYVGSVKTIIGHTEGTAGLAGLLKASLALQAARVPPNLLFDNLSAKVEPFYKNLQIVTGEAIPWPETVNGGPRRASVNSFGFGGTNAHAILESYENTSKSGSLNMEETVNIMPLIFTAKSEQSLANTLEAYSTYLLENPEANIRNLAWTLNFKRTRFPMQTTLSAVNVSNLQDAIQQKLKAIRNKEAGAITTVSNVNINNKMKRRKKLKKSAMQQHTSPTLAVFTGQGAQWPGMMQELVRRSPFVQGRLRGLEQCLSRLPKEDRPSWSLLRELSEGSNRVKEAALSQPLCTALQIIMVDILRAAAVKLDAVVGHSSGEMAAAYAAGFLSAEDAIVISYYRGLHSRLAGGGNDGSIKGGMLAVGISSEDAEDLVNIPELQGRVVIAACNSNSSFTLSGDQDAIELARDILVDEGKFARMLQVDKAYHSPHMLKCSDAYLAAIRKWGVQVQNHTSSKNEARPVWYSSVDEMVMQGQRDDLADTYWNDNLTKPVLFSQAIEAATASSGPFGRAIEIGPHAALKGPVAQVMGDLLSTVLPYVGMLDRKKHDVEALADCMGFLGTTGLDLALDALDNLLNGPDAPQPQLLKSLPAYGWNHQHSYWHESRISRSYRTRAPSHPLLGTRVNDGADQEFRWRNFLSPAELPWLTGHSIQGQFVFPAAAYISTCIEAARDMSGENEILLVELIDVVLGQALVFKDESSKVETLFSITGIEHGHQSQGEDTLTAHFVLYSAANPDSDTLTANASGKLRIVYGMATADVLPSRSPAPLDMTDVPEDRFYNVLKDSGYGYTGPFRALHQLRRQLGHTVGLARYAPYTSIHNADTDPNTGMSKVAVDPAMLDATIQSIILAKSWPGDGRLWSMHVPQRIDRVSINVSLCQASGIDDFPSGAAFESVACDHYASSHPQPITGIMGDIRIFPGNNPESNLSQSHAMIQMEGVLAVPLDPATPENDRIMFSQLVWGCAEPNAELVAYDGRASKDDYDLAHVLERVAHYYLGQLERAFDDHHAVRKQGPYVGLLRYARHVTSRPPLGMTQGQLPDTKESIRQESARFPTNIDLQMMHLIGRHLESVVRGEANMIEFLTADKLLDRYYEQAMSIGIYTTYMARVIASITHRFPHMHVLEVGAGTGGATKHIMKAVHGVFRSYTFTDVSSGFFENARSLFSRQGNGGDKMTFKVLDLEKDVVNQGFVPESYDLIIASLVLHATTNLKATMENVRKLLKPGGYLVMLEVTNLEQARLGFIFGSLPGWWLGASDGRVLSPCLAKDGWDTVLRRSGFSGIDSSTPDPDALPYPLSVIVTQAIDKEVKFLRDPLHVPYDTLISGSDTTPAMLDLILVGGRSQVDSKNTTSEIDDEARATGSVVTNLENSLSKHAASITHYQSLQDLKNAYDADSVPDGAVTVLLTDLLDEPVFKTLTQGDLDGLRAMYKQSRAVLWVARGARNSNPHHTQSLGFVRSMQLEMSHVRSQFLDLGNTAANSISRLIAEHLVRFAVLDILEQDQQGTTGQTPVGMPQAEAGAQSSSDRHAVWSIEPELTVEDGILIVPRNKPCQNHNNRYNAARRVVLEQVNPLQSPVQLVQGTRGHILEKTLATKSRGHVGEVTIEVSYSMLTPIPIDASDHGSLGNVQEQFLIAGRLSGTPYTAVAMSNQNASVIRVSKECVALCTEAVEPILLRQAHHHATLDTILNAVNGVVVVLDPQPDMLLSLKNRLDTQGVRLLVLLSKYSPDMNTRIALLGLQSKVINKHCTRAELLASLPPGMSFFLDASAELHSGLGDRIVQCLPAECRTHRYYIDNASGDQSLVLGSSSATKLPVCSASQLRKFLDAARQEVSSYAIRALPLPAPSVHSFTEMQDIRRSAREGLVIDWAMAPEQTCSINIQPVHAQVRLRGDRTYWLVGLTGSLGISLCRWMIRQGARTIVVTSRRPNVDAGVLEELATCVPGVTATVKLLAADVTSISSLSALRQEMARTLPPIAGIAQGAMVLQDSALADMTLDQFNNVLAPKVDGSKNLDILFQNDENKLDFFVMFSSAVGVTGNIGQSNYSAANMFMTGLAANRRKRGLAGSTINIGVILGVGYVTRETSQSLQDNLARSGHSWMSEEDFHTLFAEGILAGSPDSTQEPDLNSGLRIVGAGDSQRPSWSFSPKFQHLVRYMDSADTDATTTNKARVSIRQQLATAATAHDAMEMLIEAFVVKLSVMLQLPDNNDESGSKSDSIVDLRAEDIGIDSLNAVELRSWILKQLKVDVPVLRILGGSTLRELLDFILDNIPAQLVPLLEAERRVVHQNVDHVRTDSGELPSEQLQNMPEDEDIEAEAVGKTLAQMPDNEAEEFSSDEDSDMDSESGEESDNDDTQSSEATESFTVITNEEALVQKIVSIDKFDPSSNPREVISSDLVEQEKTNDEKTEQQHQRQLPQREQKPDYQRLVPMSFAQSRFWFLKQYIEDPTTFNVTVMLEVIGTLRKSDLERAVMAVGQRHEALRTCLFQDEHQLPMQGVLATSPLRLEAKTYSSEAELQMEAQMVRDHVYDIEHGRVMRIMLLSATNESPSYLVVGYHHINMDGISFQLLLNDLSQAYSHKILPQKVLQYPDHAIRQRGQQKSGAWDEDLAYWRQEFVSQPLPPVLPLLPVASARQRHALTRYEDHKATFRVPKPLATKIRALGKQSKTSPYHLYLTTLLALLARLSHTKDNENTTSTKSASASALDICIGLADAGRVDADAATGVGLYLNLLPVRLRYMAEQRLVEAVRTTRSRVYTATAHSRPPLEVVLSELAVERSATHSPLFQVLVDYRQSVEERQNFGGGSAAGGCVLQGHKYDVGRTAYDVALDITDSANGEALLVIGVQAGLYELYAAEVLMSCYITLLEQFCENPGVRLGEARLFSEGSINKALEAGRGKYSNFLNPSGQHCRFGKLSFSPEAAANLLLQVR